MAVPIGTASADPDGADGRHQSIATISRGVRIRGGRHFAKILQGVLAYSQIFLREMQCIALTVCVYMCLCVCVFMRVRVCYNLCVFVRLNVSYGDRWGKHCFCLKYYVVCRLSISLTRVDF